jgi:hypothetical protein
MRKSKSKQHDNTIELLIGAAPHRVARGMALASHHSVC